MKNRPVLEINDLEFAWRDGSDPLIRIPEFRLESGEKLLLRGKSGSGKSTLLNLIAGILTPTRGSIRLLGNDLSTLPGSEVDALRAERVGVIFQQFNLLPFLGAVENVKLACLYSRLRRAKSERRGHTPRDVLRGLGLEDEFHLREASSLSVGQQQRVAIARALIGLPNLIIADEPTSALDEELKTGFMDLLFDAVEKNGLSLIFAGHEPGLESKFNRCLRMESVNIAGGEA